MVNGTVGVFKDAVLVQVYSVTNPEKQTCELHQYPVGIIDHVLGLVGPEHEGPLTLMDIADPKTRPIPQDRVMDWTSFRPLATNDSTTGDQDRSPAAPLPPNTEKLTYTGKAKGRWAAFPGSTPGEWTVTWYDGKSC